MPAITVDNLLTLPRVAADATAESRALRTVTTAPRGFEGEGFPVRRAFQGVPLDQLDPFIHLDQMGEVEYAPGFETVTYMLDGTFRHQDSTGGGGLITNGDTQWMTAGSGLLHIEAPPEDLVVSGGLFHGFQLWVNLPRANKMMDPRYQDIRGGEVTLLTSHDGGALIRLIAGDLGSHSGPGITFTPITMAHVTLEPGAELRLPWNPRFNALAYVLGGSGTVGTSRAGISTGQLATFARDGDSIVVTADESQESRTPKMDVLLLGGQPIREPIAWHGPFVMNTRQELLTAFEDFQAGRLGVIPNTPHPGLGNVGN